MNSGFEVAAIDRIIRFQVLTDEGNIPKRSHLDIALAGSLGGATLIQYRDKKSSSRQMYEIAKEIRKITLMQQVKFIVNDRLDIAMAVDADGVHLGQSDLPISIARQLWSPHKIYGASASNLTELENILREKPNYIGFGPIYGGKIVYEVKPDAALPVGLEILRKAVEISDIPVVAIGGITEVNLPEVLATGVQGVAVVAAVAWAEDMVKATQNLKTILEHNLK